MALDLSLAEWTVLTLVDEAPTHGFAVARLTGPGGEIGRVWQIPRAIVYRAMGRLTQTGLIDPVGEVPGQGPQRRLFAVARAGAEAADVWLEQPVQHVRQIRSDLLVKLALLDRRGRVATALLDRQRETLVPIVAGLRDTDAGDGFEHTLLAWRRANADAALSFVEALRRPPGRVGVTEVY